MSGKRVSVVTFSVAIQMNVEDKLGESANFDELRQHVRDVALQTLSTRLAEFGAVVVDNPRVVKVAVEYLE